MHTKEMPYSFIPGILCSFVMNMKSPGMWFELLCPSEPVSEMPAKNTDPGSNSSRNVSLASATSPIPSLVSLQAMAVVVKLPYTCLLF